MERRDVREDGEEKWWEMQRREREKEGKVICEGREKGIGER